MNKTAIKNFAVWARRKLISDITYKAGMIGITESGIAEPLPQSTGDMQFFDIGTKNYTEISGIEIKQRNALVSAIRSKERSSNYKTAFQNVIEEVAYTWFNRLIAVRFMEVNDYLPSRVRVLSSENPAKNEPDFVTNPFDTDLEFTPYEQDRVLQLKDENKLDELFRMLFIKQCNKFNEILPELFEKTEDFSELLLTISFTDKDGVVYHLIHDIPEDDFNVSKEGQVEIIGWLYQFYNIEPKAEVFAKTTGKITKEEIPAATQLFTPDWIVRYMVENSLGRIWLDGHANDELKSSWNYYIDEAEQTEQVKVKLDEIKKNHQALTPEEIKIIDPCMGSGHILVYAFDVLMQIYESYGYTQRDAAKSILKNNLFGLDIDIRAYQLAYFAVMMKARQYNRRILNEGIRPNLCAIKSSQQLRDDVISRLGNLKKLGIRLIDDFRDAEEYGSILNVDYTAEELAELQIKLSEIESNAMYGNIIDMLDSGEVVSVISPLMLQAQIMSQKYDVVVTNPPYMAVSAGGPKLNDYVKYNYPDSKTDLFAVFIEKCKAMTKNNGYQAMITMHAWMFLSSYQTLRQKLKRIDIVNMVHLGARAFEEIAGEVVQTTSFVMRNSDVTDYMGTYCRLVEPNSQDGKEAMFLSKANRFNAIQDEFSTIPGSPIAYWVSKKFIEAINNSTPLEKEAYSFQGMITGDNNYFLRLWHEVASQNMITNISNADRDNYNNVWVPYNKGGGFRRWYGNNEYLLRWINQGKTLTRARTENVGYYFREGVTWSFVTSGTFSARYFPQGSLWDVAGSSIFATKRLDIKFICALMNSKVAQLFLDITNPTINYQVMNIIALPYLKNEYECKLREIADECIKITKNDWDAFESSWDFSRHPLVPSSRERQEQLDSQFAQTRMQKFGLVSWHFDNWQRECELRFSQLKENEEELNRILIDVYGLNDEIASEVDNKEISVNLADIQREIKSLISYAVGCMFGRYSLDVEGLAYAGGTWDSSNYSTFMPDMDNCIPITDEDYFDDDIVGRFVQFIKTAYGEKTLEENLDFIANVLGNKGNTSREIIRNYFLNDFIKDHIKMYQKRPIYWLFDSGKHNGFKGLVYMHRWNADTVGNLRVEYLHRMQRVYEKEIERMQDTIDHTQGRDQTTAQKRKEKLVKQLKEAKDYDAKIAHIALARIEIDLDDGVKKNYEKVQTAPDGKKLSILAKI